jgi:hypothetical protein
MANRDHVCIGSSPAEEECVQVGADNYSVLATQECRRFIQLIRDTLGKEPEHAQLAIKTSPHDYGNYKEVVCYFDPDNAASYRYALKVESSAPTTWRTP